MKTVHLEQAIKRFGNSGGVIIPAAIMRELGAGISDVVELDITFRPRKPYFDINQLMANTDFDAMRNDPELKSWEDMPAGGREVV